MYSVLYIYPSTYPSVYPPRLFFIYLEHLLSELSVTIKKIIIMMTLGRFYWSSLIAGTNVRVAVRVNKATPSDQSDIRIWQQYLNKLLYQSLTPGWTQNKKSLWAHLCTCRMKTLFFPPRGIQDAQLKLEQLPKIEIMIKFCYTNFN